MKTFELQNSFGLSNLKAAERPIPVPGTGEVLLRMRAVSLNFRDLSVIKGFYNPNQQLPLIPVSDGVGEVVAIGDGVSRVKQGERVSTVYSQRWISGTPDKDALYSALGSPRDGLLAEYAVVNENGLVHVPEHLSDVEAASLPCAGATAWHAVVAEGNVRAGDTIVVQGTGSVSLFALQFAKMHGAKVIVTSSSDEKLAGALRLGADLGINYKSSAEWDKVILDYTGGIGADHVIDLGGAETIQRSLSAIRIGGRVSIVGILSGVIAKEFNILTVMLKKPTIQGINGGSREMVEAMNRAIAQNRLKPMIDRVFPFEQSAQAFAYMEQGNRFGKVCISM